jgi:hypothetical protein
MKHLKLFENFKPREDWQIGDIVVGAELKYCDNGDWIIPGDKYEIIEIISKPGNNKYSKHSSIKIKCLKNDKIYDDYWVTSRFMTDEEYNLKKYNI